MAIICASLLPQDRCRSGGTGRRAGLKIQFWKQSVGSIPTFGTIGLFTTLMFLFVRVLPMISIFEVRTLLPEAQVRHPGGGVQGAPPVVGEGGSH